MADQKSQSQLPFFTRLLSHAVAYRSNSGAQVCRMASAPSLSLPLIQTLEIPKPFRQLILIGQPDQNKDSEAQKPCPTV